METQCLCVQIKQFVSVPSERGADVIIWLRFPLSFQICCPTVVSLDFVFPDGSDRCWEEEEPRFCT